MVSEGVKKELVWKDKAFGKEFSIKTEIFGPDAREVKELRVLNRAIKWESTGITWEADPRHAEMIVEQLEMTGAKPVITPGLKEEVKAGTEAERKVNLADANDPDCNVCVEEPLRNDKIKSLHGWNINKYGMWEAEFEGATSMPLPPAGRMHRRITRDRDTLELIEDLSVRATGLDRRADKAFKRPRNLTVSDIH